MCSDDYTESFMLTRIKIQLLFKWGRENKAQQESVHLDLL